MNTLILILWIFLFLLLFLLALATGVMISTTRALRADRYPYTGRRSLILLGCKTHTPAISYRIQSARDWLLAHPGDLCICSGGQGKDEDITEAEYMKNALVASGIDWRHLPMERNSHSTQENLAYSHRILASLSRSHEVILVTSAFHCYRASYYAKKEGLRPLLLPASNPKRKLVFFYFREVAAIYQLWLMELFDRFF